MHLAIGEWIVRHAAIPSVEPFAWTRPGEPYFAYSWLIQSTLYLVFREFGHVGLRIMHGALTAGSALAVLVLARAAGWRASQGVILSGIHLIVGSFLVAFLRPQSVLLITFPILWAGFFLIARGRVGLGAASVFLASALTANS